MGSYLLQRILQLGVVLLAVSVLVFALGRVSGDPVVLLMPLDAKPEQREMYREALGLNDPILVQYGRFLVKALQGDLGTSLVFRNPVLSLIAGRIRATAELGLFAIAVGLVVAVPLGVLSALKRDSLLDRVSMILALLGQAMPTYWLGLILILIFAVGLRVLPVSGRDRPGAIILPGLSLACYFVARFARLTRSSMLEVLNQPYIMSARAKGLRERSIVWRHAGRNAAIPVATLLGLEVGMIMSGTILAETVFAWPGVGRLAYQAITNRDFPLLQGIVLFMAVVFVVVNLAVDVLYVLFDPRIRLGGRE